ncbi:MAG: Gfo/Idh/MocA family oxidoreductase [Phycisphaerales bacterium]|nr:Gfo/Idh/MocA family oxidoreductase [Phycisphaerales bacterium]
MLVPLSAAGAIGAEHARRAAVPQPANGPVAAPIDRPLKLGLIGCGGRGTGAAVQALRADKNTVLVAMSDVFPDRLESSLAGITSEMGDEAAARVQVPPERRHLGFDSYQQVIAGDVDVVLLCSYPAFRPAQLKAAVAAGKHIFAEKPLAVDGPGLRSVLESAAEAKRKNLGLLIGFCWRYNEGMRATFDQVLKGGVGELTTVHTTYHTGTLQKRPRKAAWSDVEFQMRNWWHFTWISGDHIVEQAVHSIDRLAWAMGDKMPAKVNCLGGRAARSGPEHGNVFDHFAAIYEYDDGRRAFHTCRQIDGCPSDNTDYIYGTKGSCTINGWVPTYVIKDHAGQVAWKFDGDAEGAGRMYQNEHNEFFAGLRSGHLINDGERGANSTLMAIMARMAAYTGQTISWDQALNSKESLVPDSLALGEMPTPAVPIPGQTKFS